MRLGLKKDEPSNFIFLRKFLYSTRSLNQLSKIEGKNPLIVLSYTTPFAAIE